MKMRRVLLFTFCVAVLIATTLGSRSTEENQGELVDPVDDVDETEEDGPPPRPIRASAASVTAATPRRRRVRGRKNRERTGGNVQKRRLQAFRPTRAPLFEASPPDPYIQNGIVGPEGHYGHSHSPPTRDPYYSPSRNERERKRQRIKLRSEAPLSPLPQNSFDDTGPTVLSSPGFKPGKNYAFAYAVGDDAEDFSHKQAKDGPITIGEYRITLPDGRTQVVRYTAGGKHGYKADVTYESPEQQSLGPAGPSGGHQNHHSQYHEPVQPTHHFSATPASSFNSNRVIKSRPLKNMALHSNEDEVEYSPPQSHDVEYHFPRPSPKIRLKAEGNNLPSPTPTAAYLNGISSTTPTPRPNSIYDKISPFRGGKYSGSEELAYAHEHSPRAGPSRSPKKSKHTLSKLVSTTAATYYDSPSPSPYPHKATILTPAPTKKYKSPTHYVGSHQSQANHLNEYNVRPQKHIQFLQETPFHHQQIRHQHTTPLIAKPVKQQVQHLVPLDHYKNGPVTVSYAPQVHHKPKKSKKAKHGIHNPLGQYLLQAPVTAQTPISYHSTSAGHGQKDGFHYFSTFHPQHHHHGFGQISNPSPTPVTSVTHSESPYPNAYPVTAYPSGGTGPSAPTQPRLRLQSPTPTGGHGFLESPASGERPNRLGVKEALSRLPSRDLPSPKTTIHPYEVGAVDYGKGVAYGNSQQDKGFPEAHYGNFGGGGDFPSGLDNLDPSLYNSVTSPSPGTTGFGGHQDIGYYPNDASNQFDFLNGLGNYDVEQANVREIRQPRPSRVGGRLSRRANRRPVPDKRRGVPASSAEPSKEEREMKRPSPSSSSSSRPPPARQQRQRKQSPPPQRPTSTSPRSVRPSRQPPTSSSPPTTSRTRGRRRRMRTQQPEREPTMMHSMEPQSRRPRTRSRNSSK